MFEFFWSLTVPKLLIIRDVRLGLVNRFFQMCVFFYLIFNLSYNETYYTTEVPRGYITSKWAESNKLYDTQREYIQNKSLDRFDYCNNDNHDYIFSLPYWDYRDINCVNLPYSEMYEKGENEFFFMTMFTENEILLSSHIPENRSCDILDQLDGNKLCQNYNNFYTVGVEDMNFVFDYKYITSFQQGGNFGDHKSRSVKTRFYDTNNNHIKTFKEDENIAFTVQEWLDIVNINLNDYNVATKKSETDDITIFEPQHPQYRITGIQIIVNIECSNLVKVTKRKYKETVCDIKPSINEGWASKGSSITYEIYPKSLTSENFSSCYYDRYRYGIKFDFFINGEMGNFNFNNLVSTIINAVVLMGSCAAILILVISNFCCDYTDKIVEERMNTSDLNVNECSKCCKKNQGIPAPDDGEPAIETISLSENPAVLHRRTATIEV